MSTLKPVTVTLSCGNELAFLAYSPKPGDRLWCYKHEHISPVDTVSGNYAWRCLKCPQSRQGTTVRYNTARQATAHTNKMGHVTVLFRQGVPDSEEKINPSGDTEEIPF